MLTVYVVSIILFWILLVLDCILKGADHSPVTWLVAFIPVVNTSVCVLGLIGFATYLRNLRKR